MAEKSKRGIAGLAIAAGLAVAVGTAYAFVRGKSTPDLNGGIHNNGGSGGGSGGGAGGGGGGSVPSVNPAIYVIDSNFNYVSAGYYIPSNITISGSGFTPNGQVAIYDGSGVEINVTQSDANGNIYTSFALSGFNPAPGPAQVSAIDLTTAAYSNIASIAILAVNAGTGGGGSISPKISTNTTLITSLAQSIAISGSGFTPHGIVHVSQYLNNNTGLQATGFDIQADASGNFSETTTPAASVASTASIQYVAEDMVTTTKSNTLSISAVF